MMMQRVLVGAAFAVACASLFGVRITPVRAGAAAPQVFVERSQPANRFIDSMGINVHFSYHSTGYGDTGRVTDLLRQLGIRHLRDGVTLGQDDICRTDRALARVGLRFTYITQADPTSAQLRAWASCIGPAVEAFEGINEYDISHPAFVEDWAATVRSSQRALYRAIKHTPLLASLPVVGPSLTSEAAFRAVGDLSSDFDDGNMHDYFSFHEPETPGWGLGGYGSLSYNVNAARITDPSKPIEATETGYGTDSSGHAVDEVTQATYLPRLFLEQFAAGISRTFVYELVDEGDAPYGHYGIVASNLIPKPAFVALSSLIGTLNDPSNHRVSGTLRYTIDGWDGDVRHLLLQKSDGRYELALWMSTANSDPLTHVFRPVAPEQIAIDIAMPVRSAIIYTYGSDWQLHGRSMSIKVPLHIAVTDRVSLLELETAR
jgi:hypothetical protein